MRSSQISIAAVLLSFVAVAAVDPAKIVQESYNKPVPAPVMRHLGGFVIKPGSVKGHIALFNAQTRLTSEVFDPILKQTRMLMHIAMKVYPQMRKVTPGNAGGLMSDVDAQAAVFLIDDPALPVLLTGPEERWAFVNVAALSKDKPSAEKLALRTRKELWRALAMACGAGVTTTPHCLMNPCYSLADLDAAQADMISMESFLQMRDAFPKMGIAPFRRATYKAACKEGWAPAPTNAWQQAIWDKVKNGTIDAKDPTARWKRDFPATNVAPHAVKK